MDCSAHQLRHRFGTRVYQASHDIRLTQAMLGHSDPKTTAIYAAFSPTSAVEIVTALA
jgi:integrase/recombinase XerC